MGSEPDAQRLRTALRDLVALSTVPAAWVGREPPAIAAGLADVLVNSLHLDFAFVRLCDHSGSLVVRGHGRAEVTATGPRSEIGKIGLAITRMDTEPPRLRVQITGCFFGAIEPLA